MSRVGSGRNKQFLIAIKYEGTVLHRSFSFERNFKNGSKSRWKEITFNDF